jgi:hypothetical protein
VWARSRLSFNPYSTNMICLTPQLCAGSQKGRVQTPSLLQAQRRARECHLSALLEGVTSASKGTWRCFSNSPDWPHICSRIEAMQHPSPPSLRGNETVTQPIKLVGIDQQVYLLSNTVLVQVRNEHTRLVGVQGNGGGCDARPI